MMLIAFPHELMKKSAHGKSPRLLAPILAAGGFFYRLMSVWWGVEHEIENKYSYRLEGEKKEEQQN